MIIKDGGVVACLGVVGSQVFMMTSSRGSAWQDKKELDLRSTMSSPRTGILSLIRFNSGQD